MPSSLFKYRAWAPTLKRQPDGRCAETNYTEQLLTDHSFFCQEARAFDDPHDSHTGAVPTGSPHDIDRFALENMMPTMAAMKKHRLSSITQLASVDSPEAKLALQHLGGQAFRRAQFICSLAAVDSHDLMWTFYADQHRGICLEFDGQHPCFSAAREVKYGAIPPPESDGFDARLFHKSSAWAFQQEWRMLSSERKFPFPPDALKRVVLGYRFPEAQFESLTTAFVRGGYRVVIAQMNRQPDCYALIPTNRGEIAEGK